MHEVIRRVAEEAATDVNFNTSDSDSLTSLQKKALKNNQAAKLVNGLIDRGVVKRTVMTSVYGVTYIGARQQIQEKIEEKVENQQEELENLKEIISGRLNKLTEQIESEMGVLLGSINR